MRVLIGCEFSGVVRDWFRAFGHEAWSCDLLPTTTPGPHIVGDVLDVIRDRWDMGIFFPACTFVCSSGLHWNNRVDQQGNLVFPDRAQATEEAIEFARKILEANIDQLAMENPIGCLSTRLRPFDQMIQPWQFGHNASKSTCLWLKGLRAQSPTFRVSPRLVEIDGKVFKRWDNQTDSGQNREGPSEDRWAIRSETYSGIGQAMAWQWGNDWKPRKFLF